MTIALAGNPNCGKTTLFNALTGSNQYVGNWPGVTVEKKEGLLRGHRDIRILDLPGIYSLTPFSPEEITAREALTRQPPDAVLNIVDGTNLERNLYLTMQLLELGLPIIVAVNCADLLRRRGDVFSPAALSFALGCPVVEISALKGFGLGELVRHLTGPIPPPGRKFPLPLDEEAAIAARYDRIEAMARQSLRKSGKPEFSRRLDGIFLHRWLALPIFALVMCLVYYLSVSGPAARLGDLVGEFLEQFGEIVSGMLLQAEAAPWLRALILDGLLAGAGAVLGFIPQMMIMFACLAFLEGCGYLARIAFVLDSPLRRFGLSGKCFLPMLLATGCGVPAILATRAIDNPRERRVTAVTCTFLPCSAKLPIIALIAGSLFGGGWWLAPMAYFLGGGAILASSALLSRCKPARNGDSPFVMELPPYRLPAAKTLLRTVWDRTASFIKKAGSVILLSALAVWFLGSMAWKDGDLTLAEGLSDGLLAQLGRGFAWVFRPLGFGQWQAVVAAVTAFIAKENAVSTLGILYGSSGGIAEGFTPLSGLSFLLFNLLSAPCVAAVSALRRELGSAWRTILAVTGQCALAYVVAFFVYTIGSYFF